MLAALEKAGKPLTYGQWVRLGMEAGLKERTAGRIIAELMKDGHVQKRERWYVIPEQEAEMEDLWEQEDVG